MRKAAPKTPKPKASAVLSVGRCVCGAVSLEIDLPAVWAWHDHSAASRHAQGAAYATYVGSWKSRFRILAGEDHISRYEDPELGTARSFCARCGTPLFYERARSPKMVNIPRALFAGRTGREPRYHGGVAHMADWTWRGEAMAPLKGYPGVMFVRPRKATKRKLTDDSLFEP
ncbi:MAG: GFA family protein [Phenylobacterium sp.]|nr:GFA family protein [Phenylobacterium sp.]